MVKSIARITHLVYTVIIWSLNRAFLFKNEANRIISEQDFFCFNTMYDDRQYVVSLTVKKKKNLFVRRLQSTQLYCSK